MTWAPETFDGIARADAGADPAWKAAAYACIVSIAKKLPEFTADDVMKELADKYPRTTTRTLRAFGPVVLRAAKAGLIEKTPVAVSSVRSNQHNCPIRVWRSLIFGMESA